MKTLLLIVVAVFLVGCDDTIVTSYGKMCDRDPSSVMCNDHKITSVELGEGYLRSVQREMYSNFTYMTDREQYNKKDYWAHNGLVSEKLIGDCEDISMTFISQLVMDGYSVDKIRLMVSGIDGEIEHIYVTVLLPNDKEFVFFKISQYNDMSYMSMDEIGVFNHI